jgi:hypothetical protein
MLKPRQIAEALPDVTARKAGDWLRGDRSPSVVDLARILEAFPDLDARAFVVELAIRRSRREPSTVDEQSWSDYCLNRSAPFSDEQDY